MLPDGRNLDSLTDGKVTTIEPENRTAEDRKSDIMTAGVPSPNHHRNNNPHGNQTNGTRPLAVFGRYENVLLGAEEALGIDIDPDAVRVAGENIEKNGLADKITAQYGDLTEGVDYRADIVVANLMADLVIRLSPAAEGHLEKGGWYVTSGILDIKEEVVSEAIREAGFAIEDVLHDGEWCAVVARKM